MNMNLEAVYHRPGDSWCYGYDDRTVHLRIRTKRGERLQVETWFGDKCKPWDQMKAEAMTLLCSDEMFDYWQAEVTPPYGRLAYGFRFTDDAGEQIWFTEKGFHQKAPTEHLGLFEFPFLHPVDVNKPPAWVKEAVFYQIFPERFANGDLSNDPEMTEKWGGAPEYYNFFGGDLQGVLERLDYLTELGISAIYFNPLFEAPSNHKYDTTDYYKIDPHFGTTEVLRGLVRACHQRGIRVLLDGVFNHSGVTFPFFQDVVEKGSDSPYYHWFHIKEWPLQVVDGIPTYKTFAFEKTMPKLNTANPEVIDYFTKLGRYWIEETDVDGWRLDVANEADHAFWREFRKSVKAVKPDAYILGEVWHDGMPWLRGDQFDAVMNYPLAAAMLDFFVFGHDDAFLFAAKVSRYLARYPKQVNEACFNHLDTHDTVRLLTLCDGDKRKMKLAAVFQFTFIGAPSIYYGDEVGLAGQFDPDNRRCMVWNTAEQDKELFAFYKSLIGLRRDHSALTSGDFRVIHAAEGSSLLVFERELGDELFWIAMNAGEYEASVHTFMPSGEWQEAFSEEILYISNNKYHVELGPYEYRIWKKCILST